MTHEIVTSLLRSHNKGNTIYLAIDCKGSKADGVPVSCSGTKKSVSGSVLGFGIATRRSDYEDEKRTFLGTSVGTVICPLGIFDQARSASKYGSTRVVDALNRFIDEGGKGRYVKVSAQHYWFDVDSMEIMLAANRFRLEKSLMRDKSRGKLYIHRVTLKSEEGGSDSANLTAEVIGPVIIGEKCTIGIGSRIGPFVSIQDECVIGSHVRCENTILLSKSKVSNSMTIKDAIVSQQETINLKKENSQPTDGDEKDGQQ
jgi:NDP-sugar pyrophosphorylase family protein